MSELDKIWNEFNVQLLNYIKPKVENHMDADDILQEVFIKIHNNIDKLVELENIGAYIYKMTKNSITDYYRKKKESIIPIENVDYILDEEDKKETVNDEIINCVKSLIVDLPDKYKDVYSLHEDEKFKHQDISEMLDISLSTSKVRLKRAKDHIKKQLSDCCDFNTDEYGNIIEYKIKKCMTCN